MNYCHFIEKYFKEVRNPRLSFRPAFGYESVGLASGTSRQTPGGQSDLGHCALVQALAIKTNLNPPWNFNACVCASLAGARFAMDGNAMTIKPDPEDFDRVYRDYGRPDPKDVAAMERHYRLAQAAKIMRIYGSKFDPRLQGASGDNER